MSLVKTMAVKSHHTMFVVVGMQGIECGITSGQGTRKQWIKDSLQQVPIEGGNVGEAGVAALATALAVLYVGPVASPAIKQMKVLVADGWLAAGRVPWSPSLKRASTAVPYARAQMIASGFDIAASDTLRLHDAPYAQPHMVFGYPSLLLEALSQLARRLKTQLTSVLPLSVAAWELTHHRKVLHASTLAIQDDGLLLFARGAGRSNTRLDEVTVRVEENADVPSRTRLHESWQRLVLREPHLAAVSQVAVVNLKSGASSPNAKEAIFKDVVLPVAPVQHDEQAVSLRLRLAVSTGNLRHVLDAIRGPSPMSFWRWLTVGAASLLAAVLILDAVQAQDRVQALAAQLNELSRPAAPSTQPISWSREELTRVHAVNSAIRQLNMPISDILRALHPPQDIRVAVLSMETSGSAMAGQASGIKIVAEARTGAEMARYVAFLSERRPLTGAYLMRHEIVETLPEHPYRFTVEALWNE